MTLSALAAVTEETHTVCVTHIRVFLRPSNKSCVQRVALGERWTRALLARDTGLCRVCADTILTLLNAYAEGYVSGPNFGAVRQFNTYLFCETIQLTQCNSQRLRLRDIREERAPFWMASYASTAFLSRRCSCGGYYYQVTRLPLLGMNNEYLIHAVVCGKKRHRRIQKKKKIYCPAKHHLTSLLKYKLKHFKGGNGISLINFGQGTVVRTTSCSGRQNKLVLNESTASIDCRRDMSWSIDSFYQN